MKRRARFCVALSIVLVVGAVAPGGALDTKSKITELSAGITAGGLAGDTGGITAGPDGNVWFTEETGNRIGRITPDGKVTEFSTGITPGSFPAGITVGPDGNLWFAERGMEGGSLGGDVTVPGRIGRITPKGDVTEFSAGVTTHTSFDYEGSPIENSASPEAIAAGPDGNLWFTERYAGRIGRITPDGVVTEFGDGISKWGSFGFPNWMGGITAGPDGNLWFTEQGGDIVGRITPDGVITEFPTSKDHKSQYDYFSAITAGPDGNLWFTAYIPNRIVRVTPDGVITEFPTKSKPAFGITSGPDGNLWFTTGDRIGRITPDGVISFFGAGVTPGGRPVPITAGCDGNVWFSELDANQIGRIDPGGQGRPTLPDACSKQGK